MLKTDIKTLAETQKKAEDKTVFITISPFKVTTKAWYKNSTNKAFVWN